MSILLNSGLTIYCSQATWRDKCQKKKKKGALIRKISNLGLGRRMSKDQLQRFFSTTMIFKGKKECRDASESSRQEVGVCLHHSLLSAHRLTLSLDIKLTMWSACRIATLLVVERCASLIDNCSFFFYPGKEVTQQAKCMLNKVKS